MRIFTQRRYGCSWCRRHFATEKACARHEEECLKDPVAPVAGDMIVAEAPALVEYYPYDPYQDHAPSIVAAFDVKPDRLYGVVLAHSTRGKRPALLVWVAGRMDRYGEEPPGPGKPVKIMRHQVVERFGSVPVCAVCGDPFGMKGSCFLEHHHIEPPEDGPLIEDIL